MRRLTPLLRDIGCVLSLTTAAVAKARQVHRAMHRCIVVFVPAVFISWDQIRLIGATGSSAAADRPRDALSVEILSAAAQLYSVATSCTTNTKQIEVMELEHYG